MSSYSDWKNGFISDGEYNRACRIEEEMANAELEKSEIRDQQKDYIEHAIERIIPDGLVLSDVFWENDKLVIELEEDEE